MSKPTADQIRAYLLEQGISAPADNPKLFSEMQSLGIIESTNDGTAIWHCRIKADSGWCPPKAFSLLRIKPEVAWENLADRPSVFLGRVDIEAEEISNTKIEESVSNTNAGIDNIDSENTSISISFDNISELKPIETEQVQKNEDMMDLMMDLFSPTEKTLIPADEKENKEDVIQNNQVAKGLQNSDVPPDTSTSRDSKTISGESFVEWLKAGILGNTLTINNSSAKLHIVQGKLFLVTPGIFQMYFNSKGIANFTKKDIESLQYGFQDLKLHKKYHQSNKDSVNFWRCKVVGPRKTSQLIGYLVDKTDYFFGSKIPIDNLHLSLIEENDNE